MAMYSRILAGTTGNDVRSIQEPDSFNQWIYTFDGQAGVDRLGFDRLPQSDFTIYRDAAGIHVDSVSAASHMVYTTLKNVEELSFSTGSQVVYLNQLFPITGTTGADTLAGSGSRDTLLGMGGNDMLGSGAGDDILSGGTGRDTLVGGAGKDLFDFDAINESGPSITKRDVIQDFNHARDGDMLDLRTIDARPSQAGHVAASGNNDRFTFLGSAPGAATEGVLWYDATAKVLYGSTDADAAAEFSIRVDLTGISVANAATYLLL